MPDLIFAPTSHQEAIDFIASKPALTRDVYDQLLPELKPLAFTVAGVESADAVQHVRDLVAELPAGTSWDVAKKNIAAAISPYVVDPAASAEDQAAQAIRAAAKAELLLRLHGGQAYATATEAVIQRQKKAFPFAQYVTMGDGRVRPSHRAFDGVVLRVDDPFWNDHTPPWQWGCRCETAQTVVRCPTYPGTRMYDCPANATGTVALQPEHVLRRCCGTQHASAACGDALGKTPSARAGRPPYPGNGNRSELGRAPRSLPAAFPC